MNNLLRMSYAPVFFFGFIGAGVALIMSGAPVWALGFVLAAAIVTSFVFEQIIPYEEDWNTDKNDSLRDVIHAAVNESSILLAAVLIPVLAMLSPFTGWPSEWPLLIQLVLAVLICDLGITFAHRLSHSLDVLWAFHAPHHSIKRMYGFNGLMKHPIHQTLEISLGTLPLILLGLQVEVAALLGLSVAVQLLLQHSNTDMRIGFLRHIWSVAPVHRFHHVNKAGEGDVNFGLFTTLGDRMMGTLYHDDDKVFNSDCMGIENRDDYPTGYLAQFVQPFRDIGVIGEDTQDASPEMTRANA